MKTLRNTALALGVTMVTALNMVMLWEGKSNTAYLDIVKVPTICYGYTKGVEMGDIKTDEQCNELLLTEAKRIDALITKHVKVKLTYNERAALISWIYNVGDTAFIKSSLLRKINSGDTKAACKELDKWVCVSVAPGTGVDTPGERCYSNNFSKKVSRGLVNRRSYEKNVCLKED